MLRVAVFGYGYWGPKLVRNFAAGARTEVVAIADLSPARRELAAAQHPGVRVVEDVGAALADPAVDAVAIATPILTHHELASRALLAGKHVLVEKPLAPSVAQAEELARLAREQRRVLMVDDTLLYTGAARKIRELIAAGELGRVLYFDSVRLNVGPLERDASVVWDLAPHDLTVMDFVLCQTLGTAARWVSAAGVAHHGRLEQLAYLTLGLDDGLLGHVHVSWIAPVKTRRTIIAGSKKMLLWDDTAPAEPVTIFDSAVELRRDAQGRSGHVHAPQLDGREALAVMAEAFAAACLDGAASPSDAVRAVRIVKLLAAAQRSLEQHGARVAL